MPKYVAKEDCFGFKDTLYKKGEVIEVGADVTLPPSFEPVEKPAKGNGKNKPDKE